VEGMTLAVLEVTGGAMVLTALALGSAAIMPAEGARVALLLPLGDGSRPSQRGFRQMIMAMPHAVKSSSIAMKATSFCFIDGPRARTTRVGVFWRRGLTALTGRSGIRIVI